MGGVEDVNLYCHSFGPDADTVEVVSEYRGYWTGAARVVAKAEARRDVQERPFWTPWASSTRSVLHRQHR